MSTYEIRRIQPDIEAVIDEYPEADHFEQLALLAEEKALQLMTVRRAYEVVLFLRSQRGRNNENLD